MMGFFNPFSGESWKDLGRKVKNYGSDLGEMSTGLVGFGKDDEGDWEWAPSRHNIYTSTGGWVKDRLNDMGIIDTESPERAADAMSQGQDAANRQLDSDLSGSFGLLGTAMEGRDFGSNLDEYGGTMGTAMEGTSRAGALAEQQANASNPMNVGNYFKDRNRFVSNGVSSALDRSAGGSVNPNVGTQQLNQKAGQMWDRAFSNAMGDAENNLSVAQNYGRGMGQVANLAQNRLDVKNEPALDYLQLNNDRAMQRYAGNIASTQAQGKAAGSSRSFL